MKQNKYIYYKRLEKELNAQSLAEVFLEFKYGNRSGSFEIELPLSWIHIYQGSYTSEIAKLTADGRLHLDLLFNKDCGIVKIYSVYKVIIPETERGTISIPVCNYKGIYDK